MKTFALGLLLTFGAVGGIEHSTDNVALIQSLLVAVTGLALMYVGSKLVNSNE